MKSSRILLIVFLTLFIAWKAGAQSTITVFSETGQKFTVYLNGTQRNDKPKTRVKTDRPGGPTFKLKILFKDSSIPEITKTVFNTPASEMNYAIRQSDKGKLVLEKTSAESAPQNDKKESTKENNSGGGDKPKAETKKSEPQSAGTSGKGCSNPMDMGSFMASREMISNAPFDGPKLSQSKKLADQHCLTSEQIIDLMVMLSSESSRLNFAKYAYHHCWDPKRYETVVKVLDPAYQDDLRKYIASGK